MNRQGTTEELKQFIRQRKITSITMYEECSPNVRVRFLPTEELKYFANQGKKPTVYPEKNTIEIEGRVFKVYGEYKGEKDFGLIISIEPIGVTLEGMEEAAKQLGLPFDRKEAEEVMEILSKKGYAQKID